MCGLIESQCGVGGVAVCWNRAGLVGSCSCAVEHG